MRSELRCAIFDRCAAVERGMRTSRTISAICIASALTSCATSPSEPDDLCPQMAAFANAALDDGSHTVRLTTDWGALYTKPDAPDEQLLYAKACEHESYAPGQALCAYLLKNTSTEFAEINASRALRCIGVRRSDGNSSGSATPLLAKSRTVLGVRVTSELLVEFTPATDESPPVLSITSIGHSVANRT